MENQQANVISTRDWIITILIASVPLVGFIMLFVWAFGSGENPNKANWAKATLIWVAIGICIFTILWVTVIAAIIGAYSSEMN